MDRSESSPYCMAQFVEGLLLDTVLTHTEIDAIEAAGVTTVDGKGNRASVCLNQLDPALGCSFNFARRSQLCGSCALGVEVQLPEPPFIPEEQIRNCEG